MKKLMVVSVAAFAGAAGAADLSVTEDLILRLSSHVEYENLSVAEGATLTISSSDSSARNLDVTGSITGGGTIELDVGRLRFASEIPETIKIKVTGNHGGVSENRLLVTKASSVVPVNASLVGKGTVRIGFAGTGVGGISLNGDNSAFAGTVHIDGTTSSRHKFGSLQAGSEQARFVIFGSTGDNGSATYTTEGPLKLGSVFTDQRNVGNYAWRFNNAVTTLEVGALNREDDRISIKLGEAKATGGKVAIRKVGTGTLELWNPYHRYGTLIDEGTVLVTSDRALTIGQAYDNDCPITFGSTAESAGGVLKYGEDPTQDDAPVTTDYSAKIVNSLKPIAIDTNGKDITFAEPLAQSNVGGLVKKGEGSLVADARNVYTGVTRVETGTLKVRQYVYATGATTWPSEGNGFEKGEAAKLAVTLDYNQLNSARPTIDFAAFPAGTELTLHVNKAAVMPRIGGLVEGFSGVVNFDNAYSIANSAGGFVNTAASTIGSDSIDWGVTGEPEEETQVFSVETLNGGNVQLGAFRLPGAKAIVNFKNRSILNIGALNATSELNGKLQYNANLAVINHTGTGTLKLGETFGILSTNGTRPTLNVSGTFENHANLANYTVNLAAGTALAGDMTSLSAAKLTDYTVVLPAKETLDKSKVYDLVKVPASAAAPTVDLTALNDGETKGKWKVSKNAEGVYQLSWKPNGLMVVIF